MSAAWRAKLQRGNRPAPAAAVLVAAVLVASGCGAVRATVPTAGGRPVGAPTTAAPTTAPAIPSSAATTIPAPVTTTRSTAPAATAPPVPARPTVAPPTVVPPTLAPTTAAPPPGPPYPLTQMTLPLVDASRPEVSHGQTVSATRALTTLVWAPAKAGRLPLIVFAHGFQVGPLTYQALLQTWAARGYVVAAPEFPLTDQQVAGANLDENDLQNQPADVRYVTDWLVGPASPVAARIDASRVTVAGHSDGAETALAAGMAPPPAGQPRYAAIVAMSAQAVTSGPAASPPMLVTQGDADTINPPSYGYQVYAFASSPKYLLVLHGGGHLPPLQAGSQWLPGILATSEAFLDAYGARSGPASAVPAAVAGNPLFTVSAG